VLLGVFSQAWVGKLAGALDSLGVGAGLAVHGIIDQGRGIDEFTTATPNRVQGFGRLKELSAEWAATDFGLVEAPFADLRGGDLAENLATTQALLAGRGPRGLVDTITVNAAIAMWIMGRCGTIREGIEAARELLLGGAVEKKIAATRAFYAT
jgi:anthranilate phosphoribosyltransferase